MALIGSCDKAEDFYSKDHFDTVQRARYEMELELKRKQLNKNNKLNQEIVDRFDNYDD